MGYRTILPHLQQLHHNQLYAWGLGESSVNDTSLIGGRAGEEIDEVDDEEMIYIYEL